jgi:DNA-binding PadR family transcriptional regulator
MPKAPGSAPGKPLPPTVVYILVALSDGDRHGYAIKQEVEERTGGAIRLGPGTLYETIQRLEADGLIAESDAKAAANGQEAQRRYYALTSRGWSVLQSEIRRLGQLVDEARRNPRLRKGLA